jgi:hypothetical protein
VYVVHKTLVVACRVSVGKAEKYRKENLSKDGNIILERFSKRYYMASACLG